MNNFLKVFGSMKNIAIKKSLASLSILVFGGCSYSSDALFPSLMGVDSSQEVSVVNAEDVKSSDIPELGTTNFQPLEISEGGNTGTFVGQKVITFRNELAQLQESIRKHNEELQKIRASVINNALQYHKLIGTIEAKLQVGTTPGNPQMFGMLQGAQNNIQVMNANTIALNQLATRVASDAAMTNYLLDSIRAAYSVSGAVDEDHRQLRILENETNQTSILIGSLLQEINLDAERQLQYIETARNYIVDLNTAIKAGSYGVNNLPLPGADYVGKTATQFSVKNNNTSGSPLFVAKFNKSKVNYKEGLRQAVSSAVSAKPGVIFDVVAVSPANGNALTKNSAQNNATQIFQEMIEMGVGAERINLSSKTSATANSAEVQIFVR